MTNGGEGASGIAVSIETKEKIKKTCREVYGKDYATQSEETKEKTKKTVLEKYGKEYITQTDSYKEKTKSKNLLKYGVECAMQNETVKQIAVERRKIALLDKYGVDNPTKIPGVIDKVLSKRKETYIKNLGVDHNFKTDEARKASSERMKQRIKEAKELPPMICPHCGKQSHHKGNMTRAHFDNCKFSPQNIKDSYKN